MPLLGLHAFSGRKGDYIMARTAETIKIAKTETDKANIAAGMIRSHLAICVYAARDKDEKAYEKAIAELISWTREFNNRVRMVLDGNE